MHKQLPIAIYQTLSCSELPGSVKYLYFEIRIIDKQFKIFLELLPRLQTQITMQSSFQTVHAFEKVQSQ